MTTADKGDAPATTKNRKLTAKQQRFVEEYLVDLNAAQAAIRAGYSEKTARSIAAENLTKPDIQEAIREGKKARSERTEITADRVLQELAKIGFADIRKAVRWGNTELRVVDGDEDSEPTPYHGLAVIDSSEIDDDTAAAIAEVSEGRDGIKIKMHDKKGALVDIGRHLGMFKDKLEHSGPDGGPIQARMAIEFVTAPEYPDDEST